MTGPLPGLVQQQSPQQQQLYQIQQLQQQQQLQQLQQIQQQEQQKADIQPEKNPPEIPVTHQNDGDKKSIKHVEKLPDPRSVSPPITNPSSPDTSPPQFPPPKSPPITSPPSKSPPLVQKKHLLTQKVNNPLDSEPETKTGISNGSIGTPSRSTGSPQSVRVGEKKPPMGLYAKLKAKTANPPVVSSQVPGSTEPTKKEPVVSAPATMPVTTVDEPINNVQTMSKTIDVSIKSETIGVDDEKQLNKCDEKPTNIVTPFVHQDPQKTSPTTEIDPNVTSTQNKRFISGPVPFEQAYKAKKTTSVKPPQPAAKPPQSATKPLSPIAKPPSPIAQNPDPTGKPSQPIAQQPQPVAQPSSSVVQQQPLIVERVTNTKTVEEVKTIVKQQENSHEVKTNTPVAVPHEQKKQSRYDPNAPVLFPDEQKKQKKYDPNAPVLFPDEQKKQSRYDPNAPVLFPDEQKNQKQYNPNAPVVFPDEEKKQTRYNATPSVFAGQEKKNYNVRHSSVFPSGKSPEKINVTRTNSFGSTPEKSSYSYKAVKPTNLPDSIPPPPTSPPPKPPQEDNALPIGQITNKNSLEQEKNHTSPIESPRDRLIKNIEQHGTPTPQGGGDVGIRSLGNTPLPNEVQLPTPQSNNSLHRSLTLPGRPPVIPVKKEYIFEANVHGTKPKPINNSKPPAPNVKPKPQRQGSLKSTSNIYTRTFSNDKTNNNNVYSPPSVKKKEPPATLPKKSFNKVPSAEEGENIEHNVKPSQLFGVSQTLPRQSSKHYEIDLRSNNIS